MCYGSYISLKVRLPYGLVVRISGFHPDGPGSIPGVGSFGALSSVEDVDAVN